MSATECVLRIPTHLATAAPLFTHAARSGVIERYCGDFKNPEELAYGFDGTPKRELYRVRLSQTDLWENYDGPENDTLDLEIYDHWLEKAEG